MPSLSLVICAYRGRDLLERLLRECEGCYDDLVVVHDGPDVDNVRGIVEAKKGRFFEKERAYQQEPHWPFAWGEAKCDWILRLDVDEFPSPELKKWLIQFRSGKEPSFEISGYTCIWPLWNGSRAVTSRWPGGRQFLFHKQRVRFFGMAEQTPIGDGIFEAVPLILQHEPKRKSYGIRNIIFRKQAYHWRHVIARSLLGKPTDLPCWRWTQEEWPPSWRELREHPLRNAWFRLFWFPLMQIRSMIKQGVMPSISACLNPGLHHFLLGWAIWREKRKRS